MKQAFPLKTFIQIVTQKIPKQIKIVDYISECASIGKDAAYRRLRGEVEFTVNEIFLLCSDLSISFDELIEGNRKQITIVETRFMEGDNIFEEYEKVLDLTIKLIKEAKNSGHTKISFVCDSIPMIMMGRLKLCHKLRFYKWHYNNLHNMEKLSDFEVPKMIYDRLIDVLEAMTDFEVEFITDKNLFTLVIDHIIFFYSLGKINLDEVNEIKKELLAFTNRFEEYCNTGRHYKGESFHLYSSHITIETSAILIDNKQTPITAYNLYSANTIISRDRTLFQMHKGWLANMKKSCSLISVAGDLDRINYFNHLREDLNRLPKKKKENSKNS